MSGYVWPLRSDYREETTRKTNIDGKSMHLVFDLVGILTSRRSDRRSHGAAELEVGAKKRPTKNSLAKIYFLFWETMANSMADI